MVALEPSQVQCKAGPALVFYLFSEAIDPTQSLLPAQAGLLSAQGIFIFDEHKLLIFLSLQFSRLLLLIVVCVSCFAL